MADESRTVQVRVVCVNPPVEAREGQSLAFGLQDKQGELKTGAWQADGSLAFECELQAKVNPDGKPNFTGKFTHGSPEERFLYLTLLRAADGQIIRRLKIHLKTITWAQVEQAGQGGVLEAAVDGRGAASVPLLGEGWQVRSK
jgi:hypothetical protein